MTLISYYIQMSIFITTINMAIIATVNTVTPASIPPKGISERK